MSTKPHLGGAYDKEGDANTIMEDIWGWLLVSHDIRSMADIGCGYGHALRWFGRFQVAGVGFEGDEDAVNRSVYDGRKVLHDFTLGPPKLEPGEKWDLCWCAEFVEHVEARFIPNYMAVMQRCKRVVITHATPGQIGHHHVLCANDIFWIATFTKYGFKVDRQTSMLFRRTDRWHATWGRKDLIVFDNLAMP